MYKKILFTITCLLVFSLSESIHAQTLKDKIIPKDTIPKVNGDTSLNTFIDKMEIYSNSFNQMNAVLSKGFDTLAISEGLPKTQKLLKYIQKGTSIEDRSNTLRFLYTIRDILTRQEEKLSVWQNTLSGYNEKLVNVQSQLLQIKEDKSLKQVPEDSLLKIEYQEQMQVLNAKWKKTDALNKHSMQQIGVLQSLVVENYIQVTNYKERINLELRNFVSRAFSKEYPYLWQSSKRDYAKSFNDALERTTISTKQLINYYFFNNWVIHILGLILLLGFYSWTTFTTKRIKQLKIDSEDILRQTQYIPQRPFLSALLISLLIIFFVYDHPPVVFMEGLMLILILTTGFLLRKSWPERLFKFWLVILGLTLVTGISNLFVQVSYTDRIMVFILGMIGAYTGFDFLKNIKKSRELYPEWTFMFLRVFIVMQLISILCNLLGRFSLAKIFLVTSLFGVWQAMSLVIFVRILMEAIFLQLEAYKENSGKPTYFDFALLQQRFKHVLNVIAIILWLILLAGNLNVLDTVYDSVGTLLTQTHKIGGSEFTFGSIAIFVFVVWAATVVSKGASYFFEFADYHSTSKSKKNKLSSSILLIKLVIFSVGFLLAITASGIPMEKITIILGALSVGIGFGLQTIVNNLVSGIILAVEKPIEIGDVIEVGTRSGVVKEMGIRATKIATAEGSEIIVPNGDLLSQHLTNWTLSNKHRRVELIVGVAYGTDLEVVVDLLKKVVTRADIMQTPKPLVLVHYLNQSSVDLRILFWVDDIDNWMSLKSQVLSDIYSVFYKEGISLPFPQTDVHLHFPEEKPE